MRERLTTKIIVFMAVFAFSSPLVSAMEKPGNFPSRPLTMVVPFGAGGGSDQVARAIAPAVEKVIGEPITVVNKPGGGGLVGLHDYFVMPADGYAILESSDDVITLYTGGVAKESPVDEWFPICIAQMTFSQIYIRAKENRFTDWASLVKYAKANPEKVTMANIAHEGSMERVLMYFLQKEFDIKINQVSFDKPSERYGVVVGGQIDILIEQPGDVRAYIESGDLKPVLTIMKERPKAFPNTPSLTDVGSKIEPLFRCRGFFLRKGVPDDRIKYLEWAFKEAWKTESFQAFNKKKYMDLMDSYRDMEGSIELLKSMIKTYNEAYEAMGIKKQ